MNDPSSDTLSNRAHRCGFRMSDGSLTFKVFFSGEPVPPFAVEDAVQQGTAEIGHSTAFEAAGKIPALHFFSTVPSDMSATGHTAWLRYGCGQTLRDEIYAALCDATARAMSGLAAKSADYKRVQESYVAFLEPAREHANLFQGSMFNPRTG